MLKLRNQIVIKHACGRANPAPRGHSGAVPPQVTACAPPYEICAPPSEECAPKKLTEIDVIHLYFRNFCGLTPDFIKFLG